MSEYRIVEETADYYLVVGLGVYDAPWKGVQCFQIINKEFGVVEAEGPMEVAARYALKDYQEQMTNYREGKVEVPQLGDAS